MVNIIDDHNFNNLCRLCTYQCGSQNGLTMFSSEGLLRQVCLKIEACLSLRVNFN